MIGNGNSDFPSTALHFKCYMLNKILNKTKNFLMGAKKDQLIRSLKKSMTCRDKGITGYKYQLNFD